jgi:hypothetical protein
MGKITRLVLVTFGVLILATLAGLHARPPESATKRNATSDDQGDKIAPPPNVLIIGASSLTYPVELTRRKSALIVPDAKSSSSLGGFLVARK